ncbi:baseplate J/gp47 family protein [Streptomyces sp. 891-h]|uniref:baseplate J/gp47 family protein n=1 Tax=Streptomyces sp. 891-h TaxID=2720714 RepID=UPI001FAA3C5B|nr:baseplate J/gp47 family protein [Streptomyces sp. 891-h]UNZ21170.1 hypothetical protein HC362_32935 [Streptomyces sp. 891-h]
MAFGVTDDGFIVKGMDRILAESKERTKRVLGEDVDLSPTSPLGKLLEVVAAEDGELWKLMEALYYSQFTATATGAALDLLGHECGLERRPGRCSGEVTLTLTGGGPERTYVLPEATILLTGGEAPRSFATREPAKLSGQTPTRTVSVVELEPVTDPVEAGAIKTVHPEYQELYLADWAPAALTVTNQQRIDGPGLPESDEEFRARLIALPRNLWTQDSVRQAALGVDDVIDARVSDTYGGVDVSQSIFGTFDFDGRIFATERPVGEPYFAQVAVAHRNHRPWRTVQRPGRPVIRGVYELVREAVDRVRPIGVHVHVVEADHIDVSVRAEIVIGPGLADLDVTTSLRAQLASYIGQLKLGDDVLYSRVMRVLATQPGVEDVRNLHLRRCAPAFARFGFGPVPYQFGTVEAALGESLVMGPTEVAVFAADPAMTDIEVVKR